MHVTSLPDDCLVHILGKFQSHLTSLVSKSFVCPRFVPIVGEVIRSLPKSLKLFDHRFAVDSYHVTVSDQYNLRTFTADSVGFGLKSTDTNEDYVVIDELMANQPMEVVHQLLQSLFSDNITNLLLCSVNLNSVELFLTYSKDLTTLTLVECLDSKRIQTQLWDIVNQQMPQLVHLHLFCAKLMIPLPDNFPKLAQLESFTLNYYTHPNLNQLTGQLSTKCKQLRVGPLSSNNATQLLRHMTTGEMISESVTHLDIQLERNITIWRHWPLNRHFASLTYLDFRLVRKLEYKEVSAALARLPNLTELCLDECIFPQTDFAAPEIDLEYALESCNKAARDSGLDLEELAVELRQLYGGPIRREMLAVVEMQFALNESEWPLTPLPRLRKLYLFKFLEMYEHTKNCLVRALFAPLTTIVPYCPEVILFPGLEEVQFMVQKYGPNCSEASLEAHDLEYNSSAFWDAFKEYVRMRVPENCWHRCKLYHTIVDRIDAQFFVDEQQN